MKVAVIVTEVGRGIGGRFTFQEMLVAAVERAAGRDAARVRHLHRRLQPVHGRARCLARAPARDGRRRRCPASRRTTCRTRSSARGSCTSGRRSSAGSPRDAIDLVWFPTYVEDVEPAVRLPGLRPRAPDEAVVPEVSADGEWEHRERHYSRYLRKATRVIVAGETGRDQVVRFFGVAPENCLPLKHPTPDFALDAAKASPGRWSRSLAARHRSSRTSSIPASSGRTRTMPPSLDALAELAVARREAVARPRRLRQGPAGPRSRADPGTRPRRRGAHPRLRRRGRARRPLPARARARLPEPLRPGEPAAARGIRTRLPRDRRRRARARASSSATPRSSSTRTTRPRSRTRSSESARRSERKRLVAGREERAQRVDGGRLPPRPDRVPRRVRARAQALGCSASQGLYPAPVPAPALRRARLRRTLGRPARIVEHVIGGGRSRERLLPGARSARTMPRGSGGSGCWTDEPPHFFDHRIGAFDLAFGSAKSGPYPWFRAFFAAEVIRDGDMLLDIGCGDGFFTARFFAPRCRAVDGVDVDPDAIATARRENAGANVRYHLRGCASTSRFRGSATT